MTLGKRSDTKQHPTKAKVAFQLVADVVNHLWHFGSKGKSETKTNSFSRGDDGIVTRREEIPTWFGPQLQLIPIKWVEVITEASFLFHSS